MKARKMRFRNGRATVGKDRKNKGTIEKRGRRGKTKRILRPCGIKERVRSKVTQGGRNRDVNREGNRRGNRGGNSGRNREDRKGNIGGRG